MAGEAGLGEGWCSEVRREGIAERRVLEVVAVVERFGLAAALAPRPLRGLSFFPFDHPKNSRRATGYCGINGEIVVYHTRPPERLGHALEPGNIPWVAYSAEDDGEAMGMTLLHEIGHHLLFQHPPAQQAWNSARGLERAISRGGDQSPEEHFAESFAAYFFCNAALLKHDSAAYATIRAVLQGLGVEDGRPIPQS